MAALSDNAGILLRIRADSSQAEAEFKKFKKELKDIEEAGKNPLQRLASEAGLTAQQFDNLRTAATIGVGAVAAIGAAAVGTAIAIFKLTESAAEYGSAIFDASQKTGLSATTISALKVAADQSGSSLEQISGSIAKFNVLVGNAALGNEKAQATLEKFGITATDTDKALVQAVATIANMTDHNQQAAAAAALFKDRTGEILPVIQSFNGDLPGLIKHLQELGLTMSDADAKAADEFGDTLDTLKAQAGAVGRAFAQELMPSMTRAMAEISRYMAENKSIAKDWGDALLQTVTGIGVAFNGLVTIMGTGLTAMSTLMGQNAAAAKSWADSVIIQILRVIVQAQPLIALANIFRYLGGGAGAVTSIADLRQRDDTDLIRTATQLPIAPGGGGKGGKGAADSTQDKDLQAQIDLQRGKLAQFKKDYEATLQGLRDEFKKTGDDKSLVKGADEALTKFKELTQATNDLLNSLEDLAGSKDTENQEKLRIQKQMDRVRELNDFIKESVDTNNDLINKSEEKRAEHQKQLLQEIQAFSEKSTEEIHDFLVKQLENERDNAQKQLDDLGKAEGISAKERKRISTELTEIIRKNTSLLTHENEIFAENQQHDLAEWKKAKDAEIEKTIKDETERKDALKAVNDEYERRLGLLNSIKDANQKDIDEKGPSAQVGPPSDGEKALQGAKDFALGIGPGSAVMQAVQGFANGLGQIAENFILLGNAGGQSMRKIAASVLASLSAQALVQAIMFTAYGIAALTPWGAAIYGPAAPWFKAAALMASVAVVAGAAGRGIAGGAFAQQTGAGGGASASGGTPQTSFTTSNANPFAGNNPLTQSINRQNEVIEQLARKIQGMSPGDVVTMGAADGSQAIRNAYHKELSDDGAVTTTAFARGSGQYR